MEFPRSVRVFAVAAYAIFLLGGTTVSAAAEEKVTLNFANADIEAVIKAIGQITGKNFLIDPKVKGTINIISASPIPAGMAYQVLLSALRTQGYTTVNGSDGVIVVVPENDAKAHYMATFGADSSVTGNQIITQVFPLKYESAAQLVNVIRPLMSPSNVITPYPGNNTLIITDYAENLKKIATLIHGIDQQGAPESIVIRLKYASSVEIAQMLGKLLGEGANNAAEPGKRFLALAEPRSNAVILRTENPDLVKRARELLEQIDVPITSGNTIHVVYLRNADATKLATTLRTLLSGLDTPGGAVSGGSATAPSSEVKAAPSLPGPASPNPATAAAGSTLASPFGSPATATSGSSSAVQADAATNALIITATDYVFNMLRAVIDKLDVRRSQLYIEALIAEVTTDKASQFGIQWQDITALKSGNTNNGTDAFAGTNFSKNGTNINAVAQSLGNASNGFNLGILRGNIYVPGLGNITNLGVLANALEADTNANILSKPNLLTLDNEEARIIVGQNVPFVTGSYAQTSGSSSVSPFQTVERKDVGLTLQVKPQISENGSIRLKIFQEVSSVADTANAAGITTNKRSIETSVIVNDGSIIVLGGLIQDSITETVSKVPLLGDIPGIGNFFKTTGRGHTKTNLMVFLRPYVMRDPGSTDAITNDRYDYILNEQERVRLPQHWALPDYQEIKLPDHAPVVKPETAPAR